MRYKKIVLTVKEQIEILEEARDLIDGSKEHFVCNAIKISMQKRGYEFNWTTEAYTHISLCTKGNATKLCKELKLTKPRVKESAWWKYKYNAPRIAFLSWMIVQLKEQDSNEYPTPLIN